MIIIHVKLRFKMFDFRDIFEGLIHKKKEVKLSLSMHMNEYTGSCITVPLIFNRHCLYILPIIIVSCIPATRNELTLSFSVIIS